VVRERVTDRVGDTLEQQEHAVGSCRSRARARAG
jgi:hypothetical protein